MKGGFFKLHVQLALLVVCTATVSNEIRCPGGRKECPSSATCCQLPNGDYGCCPLKDAICCDDHIHCVAKGGKCNAGRKVFYNESSANVINVRHINVCPGGEYTCPDNSTCCVNDKGVVSGCCLLPGATCCSNGEHCCPSDFVCDLAKERCVKKNFQLLMYPSNKNKPLRVNQLRKTSLFYDKNISMKQLYWRKFNASLITNMPVSSLDIICPGGTSSCPDGCTCCQLPNKSWGCCPFPNANCCKDHLHCCPSDLKCNLTSKTCEQGLRNVTWFETHPAWTIK